MSKKIIIIILGLAILFQASCSTKKGVRYSKKSLPRKSSIAVIIDSPNNIKNVVLSKFLSKGYNVKAVNASDFYSISEIFDIKDLKKMSYNSDGSGSLVSLEKTYNNIYKLHLYNFEANKAELLAEIKDKWNVDYLIILMLKDWGEMSWGRAIDLNSLEVIWIENYPTSFNDDLKTLVDHFIRSMAVRKR